MRWLKADMKLLSEHRNSIRFSSPSSSSMAVRTTSPWSSAMVAPWLSKRNWKHVLPETGGGSVVLRHVARRYKHTHTQKQQKKERLITWPSETDRRGFRFLSCRCSFFFQKAKLNPLRAASTVGGSDLLDLLLPEAFWMILLWCFSVTLAVCSIDRQSGSAARRQQKWSNRGSWWQGFSKFSSTRSWDLTESCTSSKPSVTVATRSNFGPLKGNTKDAERFESWVSMVTSIDRKKKTMKRMIIFTYRSWGRENLSAWPIICGPTSGKWTSVAIFAACGALTR